MNRSKREAMRNELLSGHNASADELQRFARIVRPTRIAGDQADLIKIQIVRGNREGSFWSAGGEQHDRPAFGRTPNPEFHRLNRARPDNDDLSHFAVCVLPNRVFDRTLGWIKGDVCPKLEGFLTTVGYKIGCHDCSSTGMACQRDIELAHNAEANDKYTFTGLEPGTAESFD